MQGDLFLNYSKWLYTFRINIHVKLLAQESWMITICFYSFIYIFISSSDVNNGPNISYNTRKCTIWDLTTSHCDISDCDFYSNCLGLCAKQKHLHNAGTSINL